MADSNNSAASPQGRPSLVHHMLHMPRWHKTLLVLATLLLGTGAIGQVSGYFSGSSPGGTGDSAKDAGGRSSLVSSGGATGPQTEAQPSLWQRASPFLTRVGFGFVAGFVLGWVFRTFLKIVSLVVGAALVVMLGLSYFHVMNIDFSAAREQYASVMQWAMGQAQHLTQTVLSHFHVSGSGGLGLFVGFRRHRLPLP